MYKSAFHKKVITGGFGFLKISGFGNSVVKAVGEVLPAVTKRVAKAAPGTAGKIVPNWGRIAGAATLGTAAAGAAAGTGWYGAKRLIGNNPQQGQRW